MASYRIYEPDNQFLRVHDQLTGGWIFVTNKQRGGDHEWRRKYVDNYEGGPTGVCPTIDVTQQAPYNDGGKKNAFTHDSFVDQKHVPKYCQLLIDYSCWVHQYLLVNRKVVIYCNNGRSRSPCVLLAFFLLRGMKRNDAVSWLKKAFEIQRPQMFSKSASFPNFGKYTYNT